jgi:serralysin
MSGTVQDNIGNQPDDVYVVDNIGDTVTEFPERGFDTILSFVTFTVGNEVERMVLREAGGAIDAFGTNDDHQIFGNSFANTISGGGGADILRATVAMTY